MSLITLLTRLNEINLGVGGDFPRDHAEASVHHGFAGDATGGILGQQRIQHCITDLIADLVGMALR